MSAAKLSGSAQCLLLVASMFAGAGYAAEAVDTGRGGELFARYGCFQCHQYSGAGYQGAPGGASLTPLRFVVPETFIAYLRNPPVANRMPPYTAKVLSEQEARDIHAWIMALPQPVPLADIELLDNIVKELEE